MFQIMAFNVNNPPPPNPSPGDDGGPTFGEWAIETGVDVAIDQLPPGSGGALALGAIGGEAAVTLGSGIHAVGGWRARIEAALADDFDTAGSSGSDAWEYWDPIHNGWGGPRKAIR